MTIRGQMKNRVQLQARQSSVNSANEDIQDPTWSVVAECWARITPIGGGEYNQASAQQSKITVLIDIYNIKGKTDMLNSTMRFFHPASGDVYNISTYKKQFVQTDRLITSECTQDESRSVSEDI